MYKRVQQKRNVIEIVQLLVKALTILPPSTRLSNKFPVVSLISLNLTSSIKYQEVSENSLMSFFWSYF